MSIRDCMIGLCSVSILSSGAMLAQAKLPSDDYKLMYSDDFNGNALNEKDWKFRTGDRLGSMQLPENVTLSGGRVHVRVAKEKYEKYDFTSGGIISKNTFGYGYYESKGKLYGKGGGVHSSFWLMADGRESPPKYNTTIEFDGYEVDSKDPFKFGLNFHQYIKGHSMYGSKISKIPSEAVNSSEKDFTFGFEWLPDKSKWYLNGKLIGTLDTPPYYSPSSLWLTALLTSHFGKIDEAALPGESSWDYFKFYSKPFYDVNLIANPSFEYNKASNFPKNYGKDLKFPLNWNVGGDEGATVVLWDRNEAFEGESCLLQKGEVPFKAEAFQTAQFLQNGTYDFSAMVKRSLDHKEAKIVISQYGGEDIVIKVPASEKEWIQLTQNKINVSSNSYRISIVSEGDAGQWLKIDKIDFHQTGGAAYKGDHMKE